MLRLTCLCALLGSTIAPGAEETSSSNDHQRVMILAPGRPILVEIHINLEGKPFRDNWDQFARDLFKLVDKNNDGQLSKLERKSIPDPSALFNSVLNPADPEMKDPSAKEKPFRLQQLREQFLQRGAGPLQIVDNPGPIWGMNNSIYLQQGMGNSGTSTTVLNQAIFDLLDQNRDGRLDLTELKQGERVLLKHDFDEDELITSNEILGKPTQTDTNFVFLSGYGPGLQRSKNQPDLMMILPDQIPSATLANRLLSRYGNATEGSTPTTLTRSQIGLDAKSFADLDRNRDNALDQEELSRMGQLTPDVAMEYQFGGFGPTVKRSGRVLGDVLSEIGKRIDPAVAAGLKSLPQVMDAGVLVEQTQLDFNVKGMGPMLANYSRIPGMQRSFRALDRDNNDYLDPQEVKGIPSYASTFELMDTDNDGKLFFKEVATFQTKWQKIREKAIHSTFALTISESGPGTFGALDTNHDGQITIREMRNGARLLKLWDKNNDNVLTLSEIPRIYEVRLEKNQPWSRGYPNTFESPYIVKGRQGRSREVLLGPKWFQKMDRNQDRDVSPREFVGSRASFQKIDTDRDGLLSLEEAERADARLRKHSQGEQGKR